MRFATEDFKEIMSGQIISVSGGLFAGILLAAAENRIMLVPGIFILIPGFLAMRGELSAEFSAKISSYLFTHKLKADIEKAEHSKLVWKNLVANFILVILVSFVLGFLAFLSTYYFFGYYFPKIIWISLAAGLLSNIIEIPITLVASIWLFKKNIDPNNVMGPIVTTTGDVTSVLAILVMVMVLT